MIRSRVSGSSSVQRIRPLGDFIVGPFCSSGIWSELLKLFVLGDAVTQHLVVNKMLTDVQDKSEPLSLIALKKQQPFLPWSNDTRALPHVRRAERFRKDVTIRWKLLM